MTRYTSISPRPCLVTRSTQLLTRCPFHVPRKSGRVVTRDVFPGRTEIDRKLWRKTTNLRFISTLYVWLGALTAVCGVIYPFIRTKLLDPSVRFSVLVGLCGLLMALLGQGLKAYLNYREVLRKEENSRRYTRVFDFYQKAE